MLQRVRARGTVNLRMDPFERRDIVSDQYYDWLAQNAYLIQYGVWRVAPFLETFKEYPPSQRPASFSIDQVRKRVDEKIEESFRKRGIQ